MIARPGYLLRSADSLLQCAPIRASRRAMHAEPAHVVVHRDPARRSVGDRRVQPSGHRCRRDLEALFLNLLCPLRIPGCRCWQGRLRIVGYRFRGIVAGSSRHPGIALRELWRLLPFIAGVES